MFKKESDLVRVCFVYSWAVGDYDSFLEEFRKDINDKCVYLEGNNAEIKFISVKSIKSKHINEGKMWTGTAVITYGLFRI